MPPTMDARLIRARSRCRGSCRPRSGTHHAGRRARVPSGSNPTLIRLQSKRHDARAGEHEGVTARAPGPAPRVTPSGVADLDRPGPVESTKAGGSGRDRPAGRVTWPARCSSRHPRVRDPEPCSSAISRLPSSAGRVPREKDGHGSSSLEGAEGPARLGGDRLPRGGSPSRHPPIARLPRRSPATNACSCSGSWAMSCSS